MISIDLGTIEYYDDDLNQFQDKVGGTVRFEYSLKAVYEWEDKWRKPFLKGGLTDEETVDFYMTMALDPMDAEFMTTNVMRVLTRYIEDSHTATTFSTLPSGQNGNTNPGKAKVLTSEEIYASMFASNIPIEFENRNLNRLMVMLRIISEQNNPPKKMNKNDILKQNQALNAQRKAQLKTKG